MKYAFWIASAFIAYVYVGYALWLRVRAWIRFRPVQRGTYEPAVTVLMVVRNEEKTLVSKLENLSGLRYPSDKIDFVIVSDGSSDATNRILAAIPDARFHAVVSQVAKGKAAGINQALQVARGEIVFFTDARQQIEPDAIQRLIENFSDPEVGCASGELMLGDPVLGEAGQGLGVYWRIEKKIRELESQSGSVVGATGAIYAVRRALLSELPADLILDDVYIPMQVVRQGQRVVFDARARAWDSPDLGGKREFARKVRTLSGNYQLVQLAPWLLSSHNPIRFEFISHKLFRLLVPFALAIALVSSALIPEAFYRLAFVLQLAFYGLSILGFANFSKGWLARIADPALTFVLLNAAALVAFKNFVTGRRTAWVR